MMQRRSCIRSDLGVRGPCRRPRTRLAAIAQGGGMAAALQVAFFIALSAFGAPRRHATTPYPNAACPLQTVCTEGAASFAPLAPAEVMNIVTAAASSLDVNTATIAVVDRTGRPLALFRQPSANPANDDQAIGVARTAAF